MKKKYGVIAIILLVVIFIVLVINFIISRNLLVYFGSSYKSVYNRNIRIGSSKPRIYVVSHRYGLADPFICARELNKYQKNPVHSPSRMDDVRNFLLTCLINMTKGFNIKIHSIGRKGTFNLLNNLLKQQNDIMIFIEPDTTRTGLYYLIKENDVEVILVNITSNYSYDRYIDIEYRKKYFVTVEETSLTKYLHLKPNEFMEKVKKELDM